MRVLILGGSGMLGHKLWHAFATRFDTYVSFRGNPESYAQYGVFDQSRSLSGLTAESVDGFARAIEKVDPGVVVNCIGVVKQTAAASDPLSSIEVNALFPHKLARLCRLADARLIHLSTDCVFSGRKGNYAETDTPDAEDLYGRTKLLGEVTGEGCLTIRTSMIGRELCGTQGLLEWFLSQRGRRVRGFKGSVFSGFTTDALAGIIADVIAEHRNLSGVWHVASEPINKFYLLALIKKTYAIDIEIEPDEDFKCDRSLDGTRFSKATGIEAIGWLEMIAAAKADLTPYDEIRGSCVS
jgi:dTDP-4-dehydrorhamnose reductase